MKRWQKKRKNLKKLTKLLQPSIKQMQFYNKEKMRILLRKIQMLNQQLWQDQGLFQAQKCSNTEMQGRAISKLVSVILNLTLRQTMLQEEQNLKRLHNRC
jgi:hypothetical protein